MDAPAKREVLLVGSVPLGSAEQVFTACADALDGRVKRLPDGETGPRTNWIRSAGQSASAWLADITRCRDIALTRPATGEASTRRRLASPGEFPAVSSRAP